MSETSIWGGDNPSVAWNENSWQSNTLTIEVTGVSATSSVGDLKSFNVETSISGSFFNILSIFL